MRREFQVLSSDGVTQYNTGFSLEDGVLKVFCDCRAGTQGNWCKHKMYLMTEDVTKLGSSDSAIIEELVLLRKSQFSKLIENVLMAEQDEQVAKKKVSDAKKALEKAAKTGIRIYR